MGYEALKCKPIFRLCFKRTRIILTNDVKRWDAGTRYHGLMFDNWSHLLGLSRLSVNVQQAKNKDGPYCRIHEQMDTNSTYDISLCCWLLQMA